ncbi:transposase [Lentzea aerocolonigenes]|uniref:Transposase n=1 Tax=Lentzea aerocolonigenes TaxID=68170 RepID=A0A0F0H5U3_LENAE|nr:IS110 family transposase [Lentzea aerocolonigenes]KJK51089.1 transposase [Lentzea aerocolonigenes]
MLFVGDDWAEGHHDIEIMDASGRALLKARLPEGVEGIGQLHGLIGERIGRDADPEQVLIGIETDRGPWVAALVAAGYRVFVVNPRQTFRFRERFSPSGAKSDAGDAHALADMVRTDSHQLRQVAGDSDLAEAIKLLARAHQSMIWDRQRLVARLRAHLRDFFPAALAAFGEELAAAEALDLLGQAPDPDTAMKLSLAKITAALRHARRRKIDERARKIQDGLRSEQLRLPPTVQRAYAVTVSSLVAMITTTVEQIDYLEQELTGHFHEHPDRAVYLSQPGIGVVLGSRVLGEFGDDQDRYAGPKARKNYAGTSPITIASGRRSTVNARYVRNTKLIDALMRQAMAALAGSPGARAYYDRQRARGLPHNAALWHVGNRLVGILHGCLATRSLYDEATAWGHHTAAAAA